jgi:glutathione S-transferase
LSRPRRALRPPFELAAGSPGHGHRKDDEMSKITVSAFRWVPAFAQGVVRDLRVRWALEEAGRPYDIQLLAIGEQGQEANRAQQPFGQVPAYREDGLVLFESGAIALHIAETSPALMPADAAGRARARTWVFAALNSMEPHIQGLSEIDCFHAGAEWTKARRPMVEDTVRRRLRELQDALGDRDYLEGATFTVGDLMMSSVLRILRDTDLLDEFPALAAYRRRCEARPAFVRALEGQMAAFAENAPA